MVTDCWNLGNLIKYLEGRSMKTVNSKQDDISDLKAFTHFLRCSSNVCVLKKNTMPFRWCTLKIYQRCVCLIVMSLLFISSSIHLVHRYSYSLPSIILSKQSLFILFICKVMTELKKTHPMRILVDNAFCSKSPLSKRAYLYFNILLDSLRSQEGPEGPSYSSQEQKTALPLHIVPQ